MTILPPRIEEAVDNICDHIRAVKAVDPARARTLVDRIEAFLRAASEGKPLKPEELEELLGLATLERDGR